jgi:hypothetical protein
VQGVPSANLGAPTSLKSQSTEALYPRGTPVVPALAWSTGTYEGYSASLTLVAAARSQAGVAGPWAVKECARVILNELKI